MSSPWSARGAPVVPQDSDIVALSRGASSNPVWSFATLRTYLNSYYDQVGAADTAVFNHDANASAHGGVESGLASHVAAGNPHSDSASLVDLSNHKSSGGAEHPLAATGVAGFSPGLTGSTTDFYRADGQWAAPPGGGGEENVGANVGGQVGVYRDKTGVSLNFRTFYSSSGSIAFAEETNNVNAGVTNAPNAKGILWSAINTGLPTQVPAGTEGQALVQRAAQPTGLAWETIAGGGEANTSSNAGAGEGLALPKSGVDLPFKSLTAGTNITLTPSADAIQIAASGGGSSPLITKGDIYTRDATADARLAIGANGTALVADDTAATGQKWETPQAFSPTQSQGDLIQRGSGAVDERLAIGAANEVLAVVAGQAAWVGKYLRSDLSDTIELAGYPFTPLSVPANFVTPNPADNFAYSCVHAGALTISLAGFTQNGGQCVLSIESSVTSTSFTGGTPVETGTDPATGNRLLTLVKIATVIYAFWGPSG